MIGLVLGLWGRGLDPGHLTLTLDHLSGGRMMLGLGLSGPQAVEGRYGRPFPKSPVTATREYVEVVHQALRREDPVALEGRIYPVPYTGDSGTGLGKPLKSNPLRPRLPILLGAEGPKNIAQTTQIADGLLPPHLVVGADEPLRGVAHRGAGALHRRADRA